LHADDTDLPKPAHALTSADLDAFFDGYVPLQLARENVAGVAIAIVKDGKLFFSRGYGYADFANKVTVSADKTLFRIGSISKLFTWVAVMQQVEAGKLNLDHDINEYLDFTIPAAFGKPITLRNLMTHTAGFEECAKDMAQPDAASIGPLGPYLRSHIPARIFAPGTTPAYSNYGAALAGYIVERATGKRFEDYAAERIFRPLGMNRTTFVQPPGESLDATMSRGYQLGTDAAKPFEFLQIYPAGSASGSATDMGRFALALLNGGAGQRGRLLGPATFQTMLTRQFTFHPGMSGMNCGFFDEVRNGHRVIGHSGDTNCFHSNLQIVPDLNLGFFVACNSAGRGETGTAHQVWHAFLDRYFPFTPPREPTLPTALADARAVAGSYLTTRRAETSILAASNFFNTTDVAANEDGTVSIAGWRNRRGQPSRFLEIAPLMFRDTEGEGLIAFQLDSSGRMVLVTDTPIVVFQRVPFYRNGRLLSWTIRISLGVIALTLLLWPACAMIRRHYGVKLQLSRLQRWLRMITFAICAADVASILVPAALALTPGPVVATARLDPILHLAQVLALLGACGIPILLFRAIHIWRGRVWWGTRIQVTAIAGACLAYSWFLFSANAFDFHLRY
jgi:CubicO group peptidase (beta-lactamase class C family)